MAGFDHYEPDTMEKIGDQVAGFQVDTGDLSGATYWGIGTQTELFNIYGVVKVLNLFAEQLVIDAGPGATILQFNSISTVPVIGRQNISAVSLTLATLVVGDRIVWLGDANTIAPIVTPAGASISDFSCVVPQIIGAIGGTCTIGIETTIAAATGGTHRWSIFYLPMSEGSYVTNVL